MRNRIQTSRKQIFRHGAEKSTSSPAASHVSHSVKQENDEEPTTGATCGRKCYEQFKKYAHAGCWAKMFSELLIGMPGWFSNKCALTWKLKATKSNRSYFQLQVSTPRIGDIGHGLLLTPTTIQRCEHPEDMRARMVAKGYRNGTKFNSLLSQVVYNGLSTVQMLGTPTATAMIRSEKIRRTRTPNPQELAKLVADGQLRIATRTEIEEFKKLQQEPGFLLKTNQCLLPTPTAFDRKSCTQEVNGKTITRQSGQIFQAGLRMLAPNGLLPTPIASYMRAGTTKERKDSTPRTELNHQGSRIVGKCSQLNPLFVEEMMGFPAYWTASPFQNGGKKQSKPTATP